MKAKIRNIDIKLLSDNWYRLYKYSFDYLRPDGTWEQHHREVYDRGNGAAVLLINPSKQTVVLTRQFRMPTYINGNEDGMMIETCAGVLDGMDPEECIKKEAEEETGFSISSISRVMAPYMSPGAVTEILYLFIGFYEDEMKTGPGGGKEGETEYLEVLEIPFEKALGMISSGEIKDAKTILLLQYVALHDLLDKRNAQ